MIKPKDASTNGGQGGTANRKKGVHIHSKVIEELKKSVSGVEVGKDKVISLLL